MTNREEVAEKLRRIEEDVDYETAFMEIGTIIGTKDNYSFSFFFSRLADLIDPTCKGIYRREPDDIDGTPRYTIHCSNCGQLLVETSGIPHSPMYCHNYGTRIIRGCLYSQSEDSSEVVQD